MKQLSTNQKQVNPFLRVLSLVLLVTYLLGTFPLEVLHAFYHSHAQTELHSDEAEKDPCHRSIYHNDNLAESCGHNSHLVVSDKCKLCDLNIHYDQVLPDIHQTGSVIFFVSEFLSSSADVASRVVLFSSSRAPPALI